MKYKTLFALTILAIFSVCTLIELGRLTNQTGPQATPKYTVEEAFPNLAFDHPVGLFCSGDGTNRFFVVGQMGLIYVFKNSRNENETKIFLDIQNRVHLGALLGLAFHPNFEQNGRFFLHYLADNPLRTIVAEWSVMSSKPDQADVDSQRILMEIPQLHAAHSGGQLAFGPDGYLYIAIGDGSPYGDTLGNAQNCSTLQGKILRIDIDKTTGTTHYAIPEDNPFAGNTLGYRAEIFAYGLRNPWRFSFDTETDQLIAGDVGQDRMEEIDLIKKGKNYGWNIMEGTLGYNTNQNNNQPELEMPIWTYDRDQGNATIGGFVYRGHKLPELTGSYIYGDYVSGRIWALNWRETSNPANKELLQTDLMITSFGVDEQNELYICAQNGKIYNLTRNPAN